MGFFHFLRNKMQEHHAEGSSSSNNDGPPQWAPAPEISHRWGKWNEAPEDEYHAAEQFCLEYPTFPPRLLPSTAIDTIRAIGPKAWGIEVPITPRFVGTVHNPVDTKGGNAPAVVSISTGETCKDSCLLSDLPLLAGLYDIQGKSGAYFEILVQRMDGLIAVGTSCRPYPVWRLPGWNRLSAGWHLDDFRKFFEDPDGGRDYATDGIDISRISSGDTIGCGYEYSTGSIFYTYNGIRLAPAFTGIYLPRQNYDVFAAIGVEGRCDFQVNFGGELFRWKEGNEWAWRVEGQVGRMAGSSGGNVDDELPAYST